MDTAVSHQAPQVAQLTEQNKTKVCHIQTINDLNIILTGRIITAKEFDKCYDSSIAELEQEISHLQHIRQCRRVVI
jgi:hypothetical protein